MKLKFYKGIFIPLALSISYHCAIFKEQLEIYFIMLIT